MKEIQLTLPEMLTVASILLATQMAAFAWRMSREVRLGDHIKKPRKTWLPLADVLNILMFCSTICFCVLLPIFYAPVHLWQYSVLAVGIILTALYPVNTAAHYRLLPITRERGRWIYAAKKHTDLPYITDQEVVTIGFALAFALSIIGYFGEQNMFSKFANFIALWVFSSSAVAILEKMTPPAPRPPLGMNG